jgi:hypothetical protein
MNRMVRRVPLAEFRNFATAVVVHRRAGGNLSLLTERMSKAAHDKSDMRNHILAMTAGGRLSAIGMVAAAFRRPAALVDGTRIHRRVRKEPHALPDCYGHRPANPRQSGLGES